jgi:hypothetical protein
MLLPVLAGLALSVSAGLLEGWYFDDDTGTALDKVANSGSLNSVWNWGGANMATDGSGSFVLPGDGGTTTRKLPKKATANALPTVDAYAVPLAGSDTYTIEMTLAAWDLTGATTLDRLVFKASDSSGVMVAMLALEKDTDTTARLRLASANSNWRNYAVGLTGSSTTFSIDFNMAAGEAEYFVDGVSKWSFTGQTYAGNIGGMLFGKGGTWSTTASSIHVDSMGLSVVPEPSSIAVRRFFGA